MLLVTEFVLKSGDTTDYFPVFFDSVYVHSCARFCVCVCVCVCERERERVGSDYVCARVLVMFFFFPVHMRRLVRSPTRSDSEST